MRGEPYPQGESYPTRSGAAGDKEANMESRDVLTRPAPPPDVVLRYGPDLNHVADLRLPAVPAAGREPAPLVLFLHGGFWRAAYDRVHTGPLAAALAADGFAVCAPEFRRIGQPGGGWSGTFDDVAAAIDVLPGRSEPSAAGRTLRGRAPRPVGGEQAPAPSRHPVGRPGLPVPRRRGARRGQRPYLRPPAGPRPGRGRAVARRRPRRAEGSLRPDQPGRPAAHGQAGPADPRPLRRDRPLRDEPRLRGTGPGRRR